MSKIKPLETQVPQLPDIGFSRVRQILKFIPMSPTEWYRGVKEGRHPKPVRLGPRMVAWRNSDIRALIEKLDQQGAA